MRPRPMATHNLNAKYFMSRILGSRLIFTGPFSIPNIISLQNKKLTTENFPE